MFNPSPHLFLNLIRSFSLSLATEVQSDENSGKSTIDLKCAVQKPSQACAKALGRLNAFEFDKGRPPFYLYLRNHDATAARLKQCEQFQAVVPLRLCFCLSTCLSITLSLSLGLSLRIDWRMNQEMGRYYWCRLRTVAHAEITIKRSHENTQRLWARERQIQLYKDEITWREVDR